MSRLHSCVLLTLGLAVGPAWTAAEPPRSTDAFGDPLPDGAVTRLGTVRWRSRLVFSLTFSRDGKMVATGSSESTVRLWDADGREIRRFTGFHGEVTHVALSPDGKELAADCSDDVLRIWDTATGKVLREVEKLYGGRWHWDKLDALVFSPDGKSVMLGRGASIRCFDAASGAVVALPTPPEQGMRIDALAEDGTTAVSAGPDGALLVWDLGTGKSLGRASGCGGPGPIALSPDHRRMAAAWKGDGWIIQVWDLATGKKLGRCKDCQAEASSLCFSPDGKFVACGASDLTARLWDAETGKQRWEFHATEACIYGVEVRFAPDGKSVAAAGWDGVVRLIDADSGKERGDPNEQRTWVTGVAVTADGKRVVMGCEDHSVRLWDAATGKEVRAFRGHDGWITSLAFSPDGTRLVSGSYDCTALVWDMAAVHPADAPKETDLSAKEQDALWDRLGGDDAADAGRAIRSLLAAPRQAAALLRERLKPDAAPADQIARLVRDLDADDFDVREQASARLRALGQAAAPALQKALDGTPSAEVRQRARSLLAALDKKGSSPELRASRAVEVLERIGTSDAQAVLKKLARGNEEAPLTQDAVAALKRLARRLDGPPGAP